jgi:hypothetical protein
VLRRCSEHVLRPWVLVNALGSAFADRASWPASASRRAAPSAPFRPGWKRVGGRGHVPGAGVVAGVLSWVAGVKSTGRCTGRAERELLNPAASSLTHIDAAGFCLRHLFSPLCCSASTWTRGYESPRTIPLRSWDILHFTHGVSTRSTVSSTMLR